MTEVVWVPYLLCYCPMTEVFGASYLLCYFSVVLEVLQISYLLYHCIRTEFVRLLLSMSLPSTWCGTGLPPSVPLPSPDMLLVSFLLCHRLVPEVAMISYLLCHWLVPEVALVSYLLFHWLVPEVALVSYLLSHCLVPEAFKPVAQCNMWGSQQLQVGSNVSRSPAI